MGIARLRMKQERLSLPDPTKTAPENWTVSCVITGHTVEEIRCKEELQTPDHAVILKEGWGDVQNSNAMRSEAALEETLAGAPAQVAHRLQR